MKKNVNLLTGIFDEYAEAIEAKRMAEQHFDFAITDREIEFAIRELHIAEMRLGLIYDRIKAERDATSNQFKILREFLPH